MDPQMLELLACPRCSDRPPLEVVGQMLVCTLCKWRYPVVDGVPHLLVESAQPPEGPEKSS